MTKIIALDAQTGKTLATLNNRGKKIFYAEKYSRIMKGKHAFVFTMLATNPKAKHFSKKNRLLVQIRPGVFEEFTIFHTFTNMKNEKTITATASYTGLETAHIIEPGTYTGTLEKMARDALAPTKYDLGLFEDFGHGTIHITEPVGAYSFLLKLASEFEQELDVRIEMKGNKFTARYVDFVKRIGPDLKELIEYGENLLDIEMQEYTDRIATRLIGIGPTREDGTYLTSIAIDEEAFQRWNDEGTHITKLYRPETNDQNMTQERLDQLTKAELKKRIDSVVEYRVTAAFIKGAMYGSSLRVKNPKYVPPLFADARVIGVEGPLVDNKEMIYTIGEVKTYSEEDIFKTFKKLQAQYNMRVIRSAEKPPGSSNKIWVQIVPAANGKPAMEVPHVWSTQLNDWVKVAPTSPAEIGAEPEIPSQPTPPDPAIYPKWVDTSGEIAILKMWNPTTLKYDAVEGPPGPPGYTPVKGTDYFDGAPGQDGTDGTSSYLWIRYSQNADGSGMVDYPTDAKYIGVSTTQIGIAPTAPSAYRWTLIKGTDGVPGEPGTDGRTSYLHIKYSNDGGATFTGNSGEDAGDWIGTYVDFTAADSTNPATYTWNKVKGEKGDQGFPGEPGADGKTSYTHIAYATNSTGTTGFSTTDSVAKTYIGMYVDFTALDSSDPAKYKWTLIKGAKGDQGTPGDPGENGLTPYFHVAYASNATGTLNFHASDPTGRAYMGTYTDFVSADSTDPAKYTWQLVKGEKGDQGSPGDPGDNGLTPYFHTAYASSSNGATNFHVSDPTGRDYIGTYSDFTSADSSDPTKYTWMLVKGAKGDTGNPGKGIISAVVTYQLDTDGTSAPTGTWSSTIPAPIKGRYLWTRTVSTYTDNSTVTTYSVSYLATDGQTGKGISSTAVAYQIGTSGTVAPTGTWSTTLPAPVEGSYLWTRTIITYSDNTTSLAYSTSYFAKDGQKGDPGDKGEPGKGVTSIIEQYYLSTSATTQTGGSWSTTVPTWIDGRYMWTRSVITYTDASTTTTPAVNVTGATGPTGTGVSKVDVMYYLSTSATALSGGTWSTTAPTWIDGRFMWSKTVVTYTDGTTSETAAANITGAKGATGANGVSVTSIIEEYYHSTSATTQTGGTWTTTVPVWADGKYVWTRAKTTFSNGTTSYTSAVNVTGSKGTNGVTTYTWVKYADTAAGAGMSDSPDGKRYIGIAANQTSPTEGDSAGVYTWSPLYEAITPISGGKIFRNPDGASYNTRTTITGALVIETPITSSFMTTIRITGYNYSLNKTAIDLTVSFYAYSGGIINHSFVNKGDFPITRVRVGRDAAGKAVIIIGDTNTAWSYPAIGVETAQLSYTTPPDSYQSGWLTSITTTIPTLSSLAELAGTDLKSAIEVSQATADGKNTVFYGSSFPSVAGRKNGDVFFHSGQGNRMYRFNTTGWTMEQFGENAISDLSITNAKIANATIDSSKIANLDAGKITSGIIDSVTYRSGYGTAQRFELSGGTAVFTEDLPYGEQTVTSINDDGLMILYKAGTVNQLSARLVGGALAINYEVADAYKGAFKGDHWVLDDNGPGELMMAIQPGYGQLNSKRGLRIEAESVFNYLSDGGYSILGGQIFIPRNGDPVTQIQEKGFMAAGSMGGGTTGFTTFGGVNFRTKKTYTPSSISYTTVSSNRTPSFYDINADGFMFALNGSGSVNALVYFRGHYTA